MKMTVTTGYAANARPSHGYHNSVMKIVFEENEGRIITEEFQMKYLNMLYEHLQEQGYMWCHPPKKVSEVKTEKGWQTRAEWMIGYGYDSGD